MVGDLSVQQLSYLSNQVRRLIIQSLSVAKSGHTAGPLGISEILTALYFDILNIRPDDPKWNQRDMFVMSNGHCAPALYAALALRGFFDEDELLSLRKHGSRLQGHPERESLSGLETTSGPLGSGLSQAAGMAYSLQHLHGQSQRFVYCLVSDGELNEGNSWEAAMFAAKYKLGQLITFVDRNNIQISGSTEDVMPIEDLRGKWQSFGWHVQEVDGHNIESIIEAASMARAITDRPSVVIAHTIPGKGVDFMEYDYKWHGKAPNTEETDRALRQLESSGSKTYEVNR